MKVNEKLTTMINETIVLLIPSEYYADGNPLLKHERVRPHLTTATCNDLYYHEPLRRIFSKVIVYDYPKRMIEIGVKGINREVVDLVNAEHPKYVLWSSGRWDFRESTFDRIREEGTIVVGLFFDDEVRFDEYSRWWIPHLDYSVTNTLEAISKYRDLGGRPIVSVPIMGGIAVERDWSKTEWKYQVTFVGTVNPLRERYLEQLKNRNIPLRLLGGHTNLVPFREMLDIFGSSRINLNFSKTGGDPSKLQMKGRIFEVCLAGGFLLTEYVPGIENYFEMDREIVCFQDADEMIKKITYYLEHEAERQAIARVGWKRATSEYTGFNMLSKVFGEIEKDLAAKDKESNPRPQELKMPMRIRKRFSDYYLDWGMAFLLENYKGLWKDALAFSILYNPFNIRAWGYYIVGFSPPFMRPGLIKLYRTLYPRLGSIPYLRKMKQSFERRLFHT